MIYLNQLKVFCLVVQDYIYFTKDTQNTMFILLPVFLVFSFS